MQTNLTLDCNIKNHIHVPMEKMIQALFNNEVEAFTGLQALQQLDLTKDISLGETYVLSKDRSGNTSIRSAKDKAEGTGVIGGGLLGGLIGLLAGPLGFVVGVAGGMIAGSAGETLKAEDVSDYLDAVASQIPNGKSILIAHVWEDWETPVNSVLLPHATSLKRFDVQEEVFMPAHSELGRINKAIQEAESKIPETEGAEKEDWKYTLDDLKKHRQALQQKLDSQTEQQARQYDQWISKTGQDEALHDKEKKALLQKRLSEQKTRLEQLKKNR